MTGRGWTHPADARIRLGSATLEPLADSTRSALRVALDAPGIAAGIQAVQVITARGQSAAEPLVLRPEIAVAVAAVDDDPEQAIEVRFATPVGRRQRVVLLLNEFAAPEAPRSYVLEAPASNGIADPRLLSTTTIRFPRADVDAGTYLVRVEVDGASSVLAVAAGPGGAGYDRPRVTLP